jgi:hypothetical protein
MTMMKKKNCVFSFDLFKNASDDRLNNVKVKSEKRILCVINIRREQGCCRRKVSEAYDKKYQQISQFNSQPHASHSIYVVCNFTFFKYTRLFMYKYAPQKKKLHLNRSENEKKKLSNTCRASFKYERITIFLLFFSSHKRFQSVSQ